MDRMIVREARSEDEVERMSNAAFAAGARVVSISGPIVPRPECLARFYKVWIQVRDQVQETQIDELFAARTAQVE